MQIEVIFFYLALGAKCFIQLAVLKLGYNISCSVLRVISV